LPTIYFDDDPRGVADKISNKRTNRHLTTEFEIRKSTVAQCEPQFALGIGHLRT